MMYIGLLSAYYQYADMHRDGIHDHGNYCSSNSSDQPIIKF